MWVAPVLPPKGADVVHVPARMPTVWVPPCVKRLVIFGDRGTTGEVVARHAAQAYRRKLNINTSAQFPPPGFSDFNDEHLAELPR